MNEKNNGKLAAILAYVIIIGPLIAMSINAESKNKFASFHVRQGLGLTILFVCLGLIISNFDNFMLTISMWFFLSILSAYGLFTAASNSTYPIPLLGNIFQKIFKTL